MKGMQAKLMTAADTVCDGPFGCYDTISPRPASSRRHQHLNDAHHNNFPHLHRYTYLALK